MSITTFSGPVASQNGFIENSFTTTERDAIVDPQTGLLIYNTTTNTYEVYTGTAWDTAFGGTVVPNITSISPSSGTTGTSVTITGTGFTGATAVTFGGVNAGSFTVDSATQITATAPATGTSSAVDVEVTTPGGTSTEVAAFTNTDPVGPATYTYNIDYGTNGVTGEDYIGSGTMAIFIRSDNWNNSGWSNIITKTSGTAVSWTSGGGALRTGTLTSGFTVQSPGVYRATATYSPQSFAYGYTFDYITI